jgi:hypothetical protein
LTSKNLAKLVKLTLEKERIPFQFFFEGKKIIIIFSPFPWGSGGSEEKNH